jgi:hypothetical protein
MANENGWGDGSVNNNIGWGQGANNNISWGKSHRDSWSGATDIDGLVDLVNTVAPVISGSTTLGSVLTSTTGTWTGTPTITYTYQWKRNGSNIGSATNSTYTLVVADSGASITCEVTATNPFGSANATSNTITAGTYTAPVNTVAPAITGTAQEGQVVTCSTGTWTGTPTITYSYQWKRNGSNIGSATNSTYTLVTADVSQSITCQVTATNAVGSANATSNTITPTSAVDPDAQAFITAAAITDPTQQGAINTLVTDLKGYSIWTKFKAIYPIVGGTASQHKYNLKDPRDLDAAFRLTFATGWTHSANGMLPNGATYANTFLIPSSQLSLNSTHISGYIRTNSVSHAPMLSSENAGSYDNGLYIWPLQNQGYYSVRINDNTSTFATVTYDIRGLHLATRTASNVKKYRVNTTQIFNDSTASIALNTSSIYIGASRNNANYFSNQIAFNSIGDGLTDTEAANFYTAVQAYQTTLGRQV